MKTTTVEVKGNLVTKIFMFNLKKKSQRGKYALGILLTSFLGWWFFVWLAILGFELRVSRLLDRISTT
jgi:hypothetical protein